MHSCKTVQGVNRTGQLGDMTLSHFVGFDLFVFIWLLIHFSNVFSLLMDFLSSGLYCLFFFFFLHCNVLSGCFENDDDDALAMFLLR